MAILLDMFNGGLSLHDVLTTDISILLGLKNAKTQLMNKANENKQKQQEQKQTAKTQKRTTTRAADIKNPYTKIKR